MLTVYGRDPVSILILAMTNVRLSQPESEVLMRLKVPGGPTHYFDYADQILDFHSLKFELIDFIRTGSKSDPPPSP